jgi:hypothetical protein
MAKLTLSGIDPAVIHGAKIQALKENTSVSAVVAQWLSDWAAGDHPRPGTAAKQPDWSTYQVEIDHPSLGLMTGPVSDSEGVICAVSSAQDTSLRDAATALARETHQKYQGLAKVSVTRIATAETVVLDLPALTQGD